MSRDYSSSILKENLDGSRRKQSSADNPVPVDVPRGLNLLRIFIIINMIFMFSSVSARTSFTIFLGRIVLMILLLVGIGKQNPYARYIPFYLLGFNALSLIHAIQVFRIPVSMNYIFLVLLFNKIGAGVVILGFVLNYWNFFQEVPPRNQNDNDKLYPHNEEEFINSKQA